MRRAKQSLRASDMDGLLASTRTPLGEYGRHVMRHRLLGAVQTPADLGVLQALREQREDLDLAAGETQGIGTCARARAAWKARDAAPGQHFAAAIDGPRRAE